MNFLFESFHEDSSGVSCFPAEEVCFSAPVQKSLWHKSLDLLSAVVSKPRFQRTGPVFPVQKILERKNMHSLKMIFLKTIKKKCITDISAVDRKANGLQRIMTHMAAVNKKLMAEKNPKHF